MWEAIGRITVPYAYTREDLGAELGWELARTTNLLLSVDLRELGPQLPRDRTPTRTRCRLTFDTRPIANLALRALEHGDRNIDGYDTARRRRQLRRAGVTNLPGLRKFNQAERELRPVDRCRATTSIGDRMTLTGSWQGRKDDYDKSDFGFRAPTRSPLVSSSAGRSARAATSTSSPTATRSSTSCSSRQSAATPSTDPLASWSGDFSDDTDTFGVGFDCASCGKWDSDLAGRYSKTEGFPDFFSPPGGTPDVAFEIANYDDVSLWAFDAGVDYLLREHFSIGVSWLYEHYEIDSFLTSGLIPFLPAAPLLDLVNGGYKANVFGAHLKIAMSSVAGG